MTTTVLQSNKIITTPRYGKLAGVVVNPPIVTPPPVAPDITPRIMLDARELTTTNGAQVTSFIGTGSGNVSERTFGEPRADSVDWTYPTMDSLSPIKSLRFNGTQAMTNTNEAVVVPKASYLIVANINDTRPSTSTTDQRVRVFTGSVADGFHGLAPRQGNFWMGAGLGNDVEVGAIPTGWFVGIFVYDGASSKYMLSSDNIARKVTTVGVSGQSRISIGGNTNYGAPSNGAMIGNIAMFAQYDTALTDSQMQALITYYKNQFSI